MVEPGSLILGKYRVERILGTGGMGVVALAHHLHLNEPMAIKCLQPSMLESPEVVQRFLREARAAVKLRGEHVCRVFDVGTLASGAPYMVMEYLQGMELGAYMRGQGLVPLPVTVDIVMQACEALAEAHALGIVHRDVKPANFFLTQRADGSPLIKLLDFGISKASDQVDADLTSTNVTLGTPAYMSPEQLRSSKDVDTRADIWALGVILYQLVSGDRPFEAETFAALCLKVALEPPTPLTEPLPPGFADIVMRCLEKEPDRRFQTVDELADALAPYQDITLTGAQRRRARAGSMFEMSRALSEGTGVGLVTGHGVTTGTTLSGGAGHVVTGQGEGLRTRRNPLWIAGAAALVFALGGGALLLADGGGDDGEEVASGPARVLVTEPVDGGAVGGVDGMAVDGSALVDGRPDGGPVDGVDAAPDAAPAGRMMFTLESEPRGAAVLVAGEGVGTTPLEVTLVDGETRRFTVKRRGYVSGQVTLPDDAVAGRVLLALERLVETKPTRPTRPTRPTKKPNEKKQKHEKTREAGPLDKGETLSW